MLPHKVFQEEQFVQKCKDLRARFDSKVGLFPAVGEGKNVPMDGLALFIGHTWEKIRTQKELNLPDQRVMVANLRCGELKEEALAIAGPKTQALRSVCERTVQADFAEQCTRLLQAATDHFDEFAHQYDKTVYAKTKRDLLATLIS